MSNIEHKKMLVEKYPTIDIDKVLSLIETNLDEIKPMFGVGKVPEMLTSDLNKHIIVKVLSEYIN